MGRGRFRFFTLLFCLVLFFSFSFVSAGNLKVTNEHPFLVNGSWISAKDLRVGDMLKTDDGRKVRITSIEDVVEKNPFLVYNLEAGVFHNFIVDSGDGVGVVAHNSGSLEYIVATGQRRNDLLSLEGSFNKNKDNLISIIHEGRVGRLEGLIYEPHITQNKIAIARLAAEANGADVIISTERGGALLSDLVARKASISRIIKIPKMENSAMQLAQLEKEICSLISESGGKPITIAFGETVISGGSANAMIKRVIKYARGNVRIKVLLHVQSLGKTPDEMNVIMGTINRQVPNTNLQITFASSQVIIGEDVSLGSTNPNYIFKIIKEQMPDGTVRKIAEQRVLPGTGTYRERIMSLLEE